jgi:hypothetical protein
MLVSRLRDETGGGLSASLVSLIMKPLKSVVCIAAAAVVTAFTVGATTGNEDRPPNVPAERWVAISANAGFVLDVAVAGPDPKERPDPIRRRPNELASALFYVKTPHGWMLARIESPNRVSPLSK